MPSALHGALDETRTGVESRFVAEGVQEAARDDSPPIDPHAVRRAYRLHRARRRARIEHRRRTRLAGLRFWLVFLLLLASCIIIAVTISREIEKLFGI